MSQRITDQLVRQILDAVIARRFLVEKDQIAKLEARYTELNQEAAKMAYEAVFTKKQRDLMDSLPKGWLPESDVALINIVSKSDPENSTVQQISFGEKRRVPSSSRYNAVGVSAVIDDDHPFLVKRAEMKQARADLEKARSELREKEISFTTRVSNIVRSVTTIKRLVEVWPEVVEFLPEQHSGQGGTPPAVLIADLNKELGIG